MTGHWIGGRHVCPPRARELPVFDPAIGHVARVAPIGDDGEVRAAVAAASDAQPAWAAATPSERADVLYRFLHLVRTRIDALAAVISAEHGKTLDDARAEIKRGLEIVEYSCAIPVLLQAEMSDSVSRDIDSYSIRQPLGIVAGITPFNFPAMVPMWMFPLAIACGNAFILKPSERVPSASLRLAEWLSEAGLPAGIFNVVQGNGDTVRLLIDAPEIAAVSFVGSTPVAREVHDRARAAGKRVQALGGAKNHMVIMPDADLDRVCNALMGAAYGSAGERCMAISVAVPVGAETADKLVERLAQRIRSLVIGAGDDPATEMGPLVTAAHLERVRGYLDAGVKEGATLVVDGRERKVSGREGGFFLGASLFDRVERHMKIYREEIFGPVLCTVRAADLGAALALINDNPFGNGVSLFTNDAALARSFAHEVQAGMVGINVPIPVPSAAHSFGGWKQSMFGEHNVYGREGLRFYTRLKTITARWPRSTTDSSTFVMPTSR
ncbi:MAG: CoA-acylating methylmalonate-semialdehyde dehydrogenase [Gammaproteobacteria bacterium]